MKRMPLVSSALVAVFLLAACSSSRHLDTSKAQIDFGVKAARMNLWREARFRFERATQNNPNDAMAHNNLAVALEGAGEFDHARTEYLLALQLDQSNQYIQKNYSRFMEFYGKKKKETPKPESDKKETAAQPKSPTLPPVTDVSTPPPGTEAPPTNAPGPGAAGPASASPPVPVTPNPAPPPPTPEPPPTPPPNGGTTGGSR